MTDEEPPGEEEFEVSELDEDEEEEDDDEINELLRDIPEYVFIIFIWLQNNLVDVYWYHHGVLCDVSIHKLSFINNYMN